MSQKYVIVIDDGTAQQNDAITVYMQGKGWHVWHWIGNLWLLTGVPLEVRPRVLYEELLRIPTLHDARMIVMKVEGEPSYWGNAPADAWTWMTEKWGKPDVWPASSVLTPSQTG